MTARGYVFDVDGVLVDSPHELAWGAALSELMSGLWADVAHKTKWTPGAYTTEVYQTVVAGKMREQGAAGLVSYFEIPDAGGARAHQLCESKQALILDLIAQGRFQAFPDAVRLLLSARASGAKIAAASSSRNANAMLAAVKPDEVLGGGGGPALIELFDANVCGRDFRPGKPDPAIFLAAAHELGLAPTECVVIEDAPSGVMAAKDGGFACIAVARLGDEAGLAAEGADWVVTSLDQILVPVRW